MLTLSNVLSFSRGPLALLFLINKADVRTGAIILAMLSDCFDGFLARNYNKPTKFGAILDPCMDKFFVMFVLVIFGLEGRLTLLDALFMLSRDLALILFGLYLIGCKKLKSHQFSSLKTGKVATTIQFFTLLYLSQGNPFPDFLRPLFLIVGGFVLAELFLIQYRDRKRRTL
ncbi:MAG: CDP-alcohol phosphatidyltransferase family protein [Chlamydiae bacterium]|nr:CDP-alcohol phosphatidyltransferase family protein [Chlamydiota bacterium]